MNDLRGPSELLKWTKGITHRVIKKVDGLRPHLYVFPRSTVGSPMIFSNSKGHTTFEKKMKKKVQTPSQNSNPKGDLPFESDLPFEGQNFRNDLVT